MKLERNRRRVSRKEECERGGEQRALGKLLAMIGVCGALGFIGGLTGVEMSDQIKGFGEGVLFALKAAAPYSNLVLTTAVWVGCFCLMRKGYSLYRTWNGEDEDVIEAVEKLLARALGLTNVNLIFGMFFLGMGIYGMDFDNGYGLFEIISAASVFVGVLYMLVVNTVLQRKIINFTKEINPEKRGSIYDTKFHKVWMESCDEMEKSQIYQAGFAAMQTTVYTCISLWVFCIFGMMLWDFGILPMVMVLSVWLVTTIRYQAACQ